MVSSFTKCIFFAIVASVLSSDVINTDLINKNVDRVVDITSQLVKTTYKITIENTGRSAAKSYLFAMLKDVKPRISFISCHTTEGKKSLKISFTNVQGHDDKLLWRIDFKDNLQPGKSLGVEIETVLTHYLKPYPAAITQKEKQLLLFNGNSYFFSPYKTVKQSTTVAVGTKNIENYTKIKPTSLSDTNIVYGPYSNIEPFQLEKVVVHYENNSPFLTITHLERVIEVSHWGNIAVEETISMEHKGALLKNSFSRYDYQRESQSGLSSVKSFKTILPASATDAYYRDEIGNISTSHMRVLADSVEIELRPRFPLFGGWKTKYVLGYNVPSYEYLYNSGDQFLLKLRVLDHIFDDMIVNDLTTKIILPEGVQGVQLKTPYPVQRLPDQLHFTYLDTSGRKVIVLKKDNLVENHIQDFELSYTFPKILMLHEPVLAILAFFIMFLLVIIYVRLDFSISKNDPKKDE
ncbi:hypothetical protein RUM43_010912 [Polyplax serrata]|uniref:Dolichyl-diphosphooligosaccharide--protein glycosyltransferase subunit 1 n=2 Tax=Polyplax serrata TaxID=468196 RepID=A0AAN8NL67_POLSC